MHWFMDGFATYEVVKYSIGFIKPHCSSFLVKALLPHYHLSFFGTRLFIDWINRLHCDRNRNPEDPFTALQPSQWHMTLLRLTYCILVYWFYLNIYFNPILRIYTCLSCLFMYCQYEPIAQLHILSSKHILVIWFYFCYSYIYYITHWVWNTVVFICCHGDRKTSMTEPHSSALPSSS